MRIAIPVYDGKLTMHFGHCEEFVILDVDAEKKTVTRKEVLQAPTHAPGVLPRWLAEQGVEAIIAGGMGMRAQGLFAEHKIRVVVGASAEEPETLALAFVEGMLATGPNICDH